MKNENTFNIALVISKFNEELTQKLHQGALDRLTELGFTTNQIKSFWVPGAIEIPLAAQRLADTGNYEAIIVLGAVILGETRHFDYVCQQVSQGCQQVALTHDVPVIFGVLTTENEQQAFDRVGGEKGHIGRSCADSAFEFVKMLREI